MSAILFLFCATCELGTGQLWPPVEFPSLATCLQVAAAVNPEAPWVVVAGLEPALALEALAATDRAMRDALAGGKITARCLPRE